VAVGLGALDARTQHSDAVPSELISELVDIAAFVPDGHHATSLELAADHLGTTHHYYFDIPFEQTLRRHATRTTAKEFTPEQMHAWYQERDLFAVDRTADRQGEQQPRRDGRANPYRAGLKDR
jgi:hypothetical protein